MRIGEKERGEDFTGMIMTNWCEVASYTVGEALLPKRFGSALA